MIYQNEFKSYGYNDLVCYTGKDITEQMIDECISINKNFYKKEFVWNNEIKSFVLNYSQMCFVFVDKSNNSVMGYSFWFPLKTKVFNAYIKSNQTLVNFKESYFSSYKESVINLFLAGEAYLVGYDIKVLHNAVEDIFQKRILDLAYNGISVKYIAMESKCNFDEQFLIKQIGLTRFDKKPNSVFYYGDYSPYIIYNESKFADNLKQYYQKKDN